MYIETLALQGKSVHRAQCTVHSSLAAAILESVTSNQSSVEPLHAKAVLSTEHSALFSVYDEHRLESVANIHGIQFINDSKATNVNSTWWALQTMTKPVIWIAGGQDKNCDFAPLRELVKTKVKAIICLGKNNNSLIHFIRDLGFGFWDLNSLTPNPQPPTPNPQLIFETTHMSEAVRYAYKSAISYQSSVHSSQLLSTEHCALDTALCTVLLSPACPSYDLFQDYEDRGRQFKKIIKNL